MTFAFRSNFLKVGENSIWYQKQTSEFQDIYKYVNKLVIYHGMWDVV